MRKKKIEGQMSFDFTFFMDLSAEEENTLEQSTEVVGSNKMLKVAKIIIIQKLILGRH